MRRLLWLPIALALIPAALHAENSLAGPDSAYPDPTLTPGAVFTDVTSEQVCVAGYSRSVRDVTREDRAAVYAEYGLADDALRYEVDHFVPLELGGSNDISNLWPEPYNPFPGALEKDTVENYLHDEVCAGLMSLADAQAAIVTDWYAVYLTIAVPVNPPPAPAPQVGAVSAVSDVAASHTWYTSSFRTSTTYYCDDDPEWRSLSSRYLESYPTVVALLAVYPSKHLHRPCRDGATGP